MNPQKYIIKFMLEKGDWVCGTEFMKEHIPEYRSRINEIRKSGIMVEARRCQQHNHKGNLQEWRWAPESRVTQESAQISYEASCDGELHPIFQKALFPYQPNSYH